MQSCNPIEYYVTIEITTSSQTRTNATANAYPVVLVVQLVAVHLLKEQRLFQEVVHRELPSLEQTHERHLDLGELLCLHKRVVNI